MSGMLELEDVHAGYGQGNVLHGVSFRVEEAEVVSILGRNGAGKSTTLKSIMGLIPLAQGRIVFLGGDLAGVPTYRRSRLGIGYVPEDRRIFPELTVRENLEAARKLSTDGAAWNLDQVFALFPALRVMERRHGGSLSGGEQQMLTIARTLFGNPRLLLLDEPSEGLAPIIVAALREQIARLKAEGLTILLCEQNLAFARALADRVYILDKGGLRFSGTFQELEDNPAVKRAHLML
jgi:branched-chain amino acid transport system ATP-binding protein